MKSIPSLPLAMCLALLLVLPAARAGTAESNIITVDTRGTATSTSVSLSGRVLSKTTGAGLSGATLSIGGRTAVSTSTGAYSFGNVDLLTAGSTIAISGPGYLSQNLDVIAGAGAKSVSLPDAWLSAATTKPVVEWIRPDLNGLLLPGWGVTFSGKTRVNWNGNTPGSVKFFVNGGLVATRTGAGPDYSAVLNVDTMFTPSLLPDRNKILVTATAADGSSIGDLSINVVVLTVPGALNAFLVDPANIGRDGNKLHVNGKIPEPAVKKTVTLPFIGTFGAEIQVEGEFNYSLSSGKFEFDVGPGAAGVTKGASLLFGNKEISVDIGAHGEGVATTTQGIRLEELSLYTGLSYQGTFDFPVASALDLFGPGITSTLSKIPGLKEKLKPVSLTLWVKPNLSGLAYWNLNPIGFDRFKLEGKLGLDLGYEADIAIAKVKVYVGGEPSVAFQIPGDVFEQIGFRAYAGFEAKAWILQIGPVEYVFVEYSYPSAAHRLPLTGIQDTGTGYLIGAEGNNNATWQPMARPWRNAGDEVFLQDASGPARRLADSSALNTFSRMGLAPSPGAVFVPGTGPSRRIASDPSLPTQAELPLVQNVFPDSEPNLAGKGNDLMQLYVRDTGVSNPVQFTEIAWTRFDGTSWTTPSAIAADPRGQFEPSVAFDGPGAAVAVWTRIKDPAFSGTEISDLAAQMEIVSAKWNPATGTWGAVTSITDNAFLDHNPRLAGPLADGSLILTWRENQANLLVGTGAADAVENTRIMTRRWDSATGIWGAPQTLVPDLSSELSDSLAAGGNKAVFVVSRDMDGNLDDFSDSELFYRVFDGATGAWGTLTRYTNDSINDRNAKVAIDGSGGVYCVWQRGNDLVMDRNFSGAPSPVRPDSATLGFSDFALTVGPGGNVVAVWQEMDEFGSDAHYRVFDPASNTWGLDTLLSNDSDLERSFSLVWDPMANLVLAYNNVAISKVTKTVTLEGGATVDVPGVPQPGQVDLLLAKRALVKDLSLGADSLTADGTTFQAGDTITLAAKVTNSGNVAEQNVQVGFYDGDPQSGGTLIQTVTLPGWLKAADTTEATINWTIPAPVAAHTVYAVVDSGAQVTESDETNNAQSLSLNGVDLELTYLSGSVAADGSVHVVAQVKNIGAPASPVTTLNLWPQTNPGTTPLGTMDVSLLDPGDSVQVVLDLPAGSQAEGDASYRLSVDEDKLSGDIDTSNNETLFSLYLFVSSANDNIPDSWKRQYGFSVSDSSVAGADSDGDGFTNFQEYLCGTNPTDAASKLKIGDMNVVMQPDGKSAQFTVSWVPAANRSYTVERSFDLKTWDAVATHIQGVPPLNSYTDNVTFPLGGKKCFYRVRVE